MRRGRLALFTRADCHLCTEMMTVARPIAERHGFAIEVIDIDDDPELARQYNLLIPLLALDGEEICHHWIDTDALESALCQRGADA